MMNLLILASDTPQVARKRSLLATNNHSSNSKQKERPSPEEATCSILSQGQMFVRYKPPSILVSLVVAVLVSSMFSTTTYDNLVDGGLIHIYHKYRPKLTDSQEQLLNLSSSSSSIIQPGAEENYQQQAATAPGGGEHTISRSIEYTSPMKRIMELIGHHSPVIVVSSSEQQTTGNQQQQQPSEIGQQVGHTVTTISAGSPSLPTLVQASTSADGDIQSNQPPPATTLNPTLLGATTSHRQQWTLLDTNQAAMMQPIQLAAQQQQLIQSTVPYEQYYLTPSQITDSNGNGQFAVVPANLGFSPATSYQQIAALPYTSSSAEPNSQQLASAYSQQHTSSQEDRAQPIFLSSYVPEIPIQGKYAFQPANYLTQQLIEQRPDSIQQIQHSQVQQMMPPQQLLSHGNGGGSENKQSKFKVDGGGGDDHTRSSPGQTTSPDSDSIDSDADGDIAGVKTNNRDQTSVVEEPDDLEEASKSKRSNLDNPSNHNDEQDEQPSGNTSGSMTYEDKYDSDKDDNNSPANKNQKAESSNNIVVNGLVNVGLNDDCLQCICRASSGCDHLLRCITRGSEEKYCGPFQLTEEYWNMAGSPGDAANNFISFEDCANEADCAVETVTNYMKKYHKDCDGDENITCMDYARLHKLKPAECDNTDKLVNDFDAYWAKFQRCAEGYNRSRNGDDEDI